MQTLTIVEGIVFGQVGAGTVVPFTARPKRKWLPLPKTARPFDKYAEYEVSGDSLEGVGIYDGYLLTCRRNFERSEIKPNKVFIVRILPTGEQIAKMISFGNGTITLNSANPLYPPKTYSAKDIEILALVVEIRIPI